MKHTQSFVIALLLAVSMACTAYAEEQERGWFWLVSALQSQGIDPNRVAWAQVNQSCMGESPQSDAFTACQYEKVMDREQYGADLALCEGEAVSAYPRSLAAPVPAAPYGWPYSRVNYSQKEVKLSRVAYARRCMVELGWKNPDNYLMGRREASLGAKFAAEKWSN